MSSEWKWYKKEYSVHDYAFGRMVVVQAAGTEQKAKRERDLSHSLTKPLELFPALEKVCFSISMSNRFSGLFHPAAKPPYNSNVSISFSLRSTLRLHVRYIPRPTRVSFVDQHPFALSVFAMSNFCDRPVTKSFLFLVSSRSCVWLVGKESRRRKH